MPDLLRLWRRWVLPGFGALAGVGVIGDGVTDGYAFQILYLPLALGAGAEAWMGTARVQRSVAAPALAVEAATPGVRGVIAWIGRAIAKSLLALFAIIFALMMLAIAVGLVTAIKEHWRIAVPILLALGLLVVLAVRWMNAEADKVAPRDGPEALAQALRTTPPVFLDVLSTAPDEDTRPKGKIRTSWRLGCRCGGATGRLLAHARGPEAVVGPLAFSCVACSRDTEFFALDDPRFQAEAPDSERLPYHCPRCGGTEMALAVRLTYDLGGLSKAAPQEAFQRLEIRCLCPERHRSTPVDLSTS